MQVDPDQPCDVHRAILFLELELVSALTLLSKDDAEAACLQSSPFGHASTFFCNDGFERPHAAPGKASLSPVAPRRA